MSAFNDFEKAQKLSTTMCCSGTYCNVVFRYGHVHACDHEVQCGVVVYFTYLGWCSIIVRHLRVGGDVGGCGCVRVRG